MTVLPRKAWGAQPPKQPLQPIKRPVPLVFIHHEAAVYTETDEASDFAEARKIQRFHMRSRKYNDIAYSFLVFPSGRVLEGRGWAKRGGHTGGKKTPHADENAISHGICFIGNFETQQPTKAALQAGISLIRLGIAKGYIKASPEIFGHRDVDATACPGKNLYAKLTAIRTGVAADDVETADDGSVRVWFYARTRAGVAIVRSRAADRAWQAARTRVVKGEAIVFTKEPVR